jgi:hypothetical protein
MNINPIHAGQVAFARRLVDSVRRTNEAADPKSAATVPDAEKTTFARDITLRRLTSNCASSPLQRRLQSG